MYSACIPHARGPQPDHAARALPSSLLKILVALEKSAAFGGSDAIGATTRQRFERNLSPRSRFSSDC